MIAKIDEMSKAKDSNKWQDYEKKRKEDSLKVQENQRARGRSLDSNVSPRSRTPQSFEQKVNKQAKIQNGDKTHAERINPEKAAKDPRIQALKEQKAKANQVQITHSSLHSSTSLTAPDVAKKQVQKATTLQGRARVMVKQESAKDNSQEKASRLQAKAKANSKATPVPKSPPTKDKGKTK